MERSRNDNHPQPEAAITLPSIIKITPSDIHPGICIGNYYIVVLFPFFLTRVTNSSRYTGKLLTNYLLLIRSEITIFISFDC